MSRTSYCIHKILNNTSLTCFTYCLKHSPPARKARQHCPLLSKQTNTSDLALPSLSFLTAYASTMTFIYWPHRSLNLTISCLSQTHTSTELSTRVSSLAFFVFIRDADRSINSIKSCCTVVYHLHWPNHYLALRCKLNKSEHRLRH